MSEKPWYQDGFVVLASVFFGGLFLWAMIQGPKELVIPKYRGALTNPILADPTFEITLWHQHPGNLRNGVLKVTTLGEMSPNPDGHTETFSFETWQPNETNGVHLSLPLKRSNADAVLTLRIELEAKNAQRSVFHAKWQGMGWVK